MISDFNIHKGNRKIQQFGASQVSTSTLTVHPSATPTTDPSTPPQIECNIDQYELYISITTDGFPNENFWALKTIDGTLIQKDGPFLERYTTHDSKECLDHSECYIFTIYDSWGDGFSRFSGDLIVSIDDVVVMTKPSDRFRSLDLFLGDECNTLPSSMPLSRPSTSPSFSSSPSLVPTYSLKPSISSTLSQSPTMKCRSDQHELHVKITTDMHPSETSWSVQTYNGTLFRESSPFLNRDTKYSSKMCLDKSECYSFTIYDSWGDGFDTDKGNLAVSLDDKVVMTRPEDNFSSLEVSVGDGCNFLPSPKPSSFPSESPSAAPTPVIVCSENQLSLNVSITTDGYPHETTWAVENSNGTTMFEYGPLSESYQTFNTNKCFDPSKCYAFRIEDSLGDGIFSEGDFVVSVNDVILMTNPQMKFESLNIAFGQCSIEPSLIPTVSPSRIKSTIPTTAPSTGPSIVHSILPTISESSVLSAFNSVPPSAIVSTQPSPSETSSSPTSVSHSNTSSPPTPDIIQLSPTPSYNPTATQTIKPTRPLPEFHFSSKDVSNLNSSSNISTLSVTYTIITIITINLLFM